MTVATILPQSAPSSDSDPTAAELDQPRPRTVRRRRAVLARGAGPGRTRPRSVGCLCPPLGSGRRLAAPASPVGL